MVMDLYIDILIRECKILETLQYFGKNELILNIIYIPLNICDTFYTKILL